MLISLEWLKEYLPDLTSDPEKIEEALTLIGFEVDDIEHHGLPPLDKVVVGEVLDREQHPNADRLSVCRVTTGGDADHQIVCGAKNFKVGDRVPVALVGAELPGGFKIQEAKLRGVESKGMMCSAKELGLGEDHSGLMILDNQPDLGISINDLYPDGDIVFDVEITPNRPDCLSHIGLARELAAYFDLEFNTPVPLTKLEEFDSEAKDGLIDYVKVEDVNYCPYYTAHSIAGVRIEESPSWLKKRIEAIGLRPINNVVDVTNFVLHETGQPLHAFDAAKIKGGGLTVRTATEGEKITTLDDKERALRTHDHLIADEERGLVIAGVMGSLDAEVDDSTKDVVLETAWFDRKITRKTSRELGLSTDSSYRFERGIDPKGVDFAAMRAIDLIIEVAGGTLAKRNIIVGSNNISHPDIEITPDWIRDRCGFEISDEKMESSLSALGLEISKAEDSKNWTVSIPSFRADLERPIDLVEEVLRMFGTHRIPESSVNTRALLRDHSNEWNVRQRWCKYLVSNGFNEAYNYTLFDGEKLQVDGEGLEANKLLNPISVDQTHLRPSLIPGLLDVVKSHQNHGFANGRFFEWGRVFIEEGDHITECFSIAFVIRESGDFRHWLDREKTDFYKSKALVYGLLKLAGLTLPDQLIRMDDIPVFGQSGHYMSGASLKKGGFIAECGMIDLQFQKKLDIEGNLYAGSISLLPSRLDLKPKPKEYKTFSQFPPTYKDLALVVEKSVSASKVRDSLAKAAKSAAGDRFLVDSVELFDVYEGKGLEDNQKSLAFSMTFRGKDGTLKDTDVNTAFDTIQKTIEKKTDFRVRR